MFVLFQPNHPWYHRPCVPAGAGQAPQEAARRPDHPDPDPARGSPPAAGVASVRAPRGLAGLGAGAAGGELVPGPVLPVLHAGLQYDGGAGGQGMADIFYLKDKS